MPCSFNIPRRIGFFSQAILVFAVIAMASIAVAGQCLKPGVTMSKALMAPFTYYPVGAADFNGDGKQDLAVSKGNGKVGIMMGTASGYLSPSTDYTVGDGLSFLFGDLSGDGKAEMLFFHGGIVDVWMNNGSGAFAFQSTFNASQLFGMMIADISGDGKGDLIYISGSGGLFYPAVRVGNGAGAFTGEIGYFDVVPNFPLQSIHLGDFNGDGKLDIAASLYNSLNEPLVAKVRLYLNDGSGGLTIMSPIDVGAASISAAGDLNNDGKTDLVGVNPTGGTMTVLLNNGSNAFTPTVIAVNTRPEAASVVDFNGDGKKDVYLRYDITSTTYAGSSIMLGDGVGGVTRFDIAKPDIRPMFLGDFNGDGRTDLIDYSNQSLTREGLITVWSGSCSAINDTRTIDYDGDGITEIAMFRPSNGNWYRLAGNGSTVVTHFGVTGDIPTPGDFDGDGKTDLTVFRPSNGAWYTKRSTDGVETGLQFGQSGDKPVPGDYDGDGKSDIAVYRPSQGGWYILRSSDNSFLGIQFGISSDAPVPADFDGDGKTDVAVFRGSDGGWYMIMSSTGAFSGVTWGTSGDKAVPADYDGDGKADIAVFRPGPGDWYILRSFNSALLALHWGQTGDIPTPGIYSAESNNSLPSIWRPSTGVMWANNGITYINNTLGTNGDIPVSTPFTVQ
ncbi:MAG: VCBS repeat-containing protein [Pyrinomonadaceae bacterium]